MLLIWILEPGFDGRSSYPGSLFFREWSGATKWITELGFEKIKFLISKKWCKIFLLLIISIHSKVSCQIDTSSNLKEFSGKIVYKYDRVLKTYQCEEILSPLIDSMVIYYRKGFIQIIEYIKGKITGYTLYNPNANKIFRNNKTLDSIYCQEGNINESISSLKYFVDLKCNQKILNYQCKCISGELSPKSNITIYYAKELYINPNSIKSNIVAATYYFNTTNSLYLKYILNLEGCKEIYTAIRIEKQDFTISDFELFKLPIIAAAPKKG